MNHSIEVSALGNYKVLALVTRGLIHMYMYMYVCVFSTVYMQCMYNVNMNSNYFKQH